MEYQNLFYTVMEAEGDLVQPFDDGGDTAPTEAPPPEPPSPAPDGSDEPPPLAEDDSMSFDDSDGGFDDGNDPDGNDEDSENNQNGGEKTSEKANAILNQRLYQKLLERNKKVEDTIENLQKIIPMLPYEVVRETDPSMNRLKTALEKGKAYAINKFIDAKYGENLLFFQKLDALYTLICDDIDVQLKKLNQEKH